MAEDKITPSKLLERYCKNVVSYLKLDNMLEQLTNSAYGKTVWTVWSISFDRIKAKDPLAADLLRFFALLHPDIISVIFFLHHSQNVLGLVDSLSARSVDIVLNRLCDFSLIYRTIRSDASDEDPAKDTFVIYRLVRTARALPRL
jgi:hypothetical protein